MRNLSPLLILKIWGNSLTNFLPSFVPTGTASVARAWSFTFDNLVGQAVSQFFKSYMSTKVPGNLMSEYPDLFAVLLIVLLTGITPNDSLSSDITSSSIAFTFYISPFKLH